MNIKNLYAYYIFSKDSSNEESSIPLDFLIYISTLPIQKRWDAEFEENSSPVTITKPMWLDGYKNRYLYGKFVEVKLREKIDLIDLNGAEESIQIPKGKGEKLEFDFIFCPTSHVALIETKGRGCENKILNFLRRHWEKYKKNNPSLPTLWMESRAIIIEDSARAYLNDKSVSSMQMVIDCSKIGTDPSLLPLLTQLIKGHDGNLEELALNVSISTVKRSAGLPKIAMTNTIDILEQLEVKEALKSAACVELIANRKSSRQTKLVDIHLKKGVMIPEECETSDLLKEELDNLIDKLMSELYEV